MTPDKQRLSIAAGQDVLMSRILAGLGLIGSALVLASALTAPAFSAGLDLAAQKKRPHITIYPRRVHPGPNAKRQCYSWLVKEYRVSGPVIVPQMRCWWEQATR